MNRRDLLKLSIASLAAFVLPAPRKRINLSEFCGTERPKWDLRLPFVLTDWTYATDAFGCVRVRPESGDVVQREGAIPPFASLSWNHSKLNRGLWQSMPKLFPIIAADSDCPTCEGTGYAPGVTVVECEYCYGVGHTWPGSWMTTTPTLCRPCKGRGHFAVCEECRTCGGEGVGDFPAIVELNGWFYDAKLYERFRRLDGECCQDFWNGNASYPMMKVIFDGGEGMFMGVDRETAMRRIREAKE